VKKAVYGTLILFIGILIAAAIISLRHPVEEVKYESGRVVPASGQ
jgi:hypothetical protein